MGRKSSSTAALLERATFQLSGKRELARNERDDLQDYLSSLNKRTGNKKKSVTFEDISDIDISSDNEPASCYKGIDLRGSKFLKKPTQTETEHSAVKQVYKPANGQSLAGSNMGPRSRQVPEVLTRAASASTLQASSLGSFQSYSRVQKSSALARAAMLTNKFSQRVVKSADSKPLWTDFHSDVSSVEMTGDWKEEKEQDTISEDSIGKYGHRFLKKLKEQTVPQTSGDEKSKVFPSAQAAKVPSPPQLLRTPTPPEKMLTPSTKYPNAAAPPMLKSSYRYGTNVVLTSEEESLADFIQQLTPSMSEVTDRSKESSQMMTRATKGISLRTSSRSPSPRNRAQSPRFSVRSLQRCSPSPRSVSMESVVTESATFGIIEEVQEEESDSVISYGLKENIFSIDDLKPAMATAEMMKDESQMPKDATTKYFSTFGLKMVEELPETEASVIGTAMGADIFDNETTHSKLKAEETASERISEIRSNSSISKQGFVPSSQDSITEKIGLSPAPFSHGKTSTISEVVFQHSSKTEDSDYTDDFETDEDESTSHNVGTKPSKMETEQLPNQRTVETQTDDNTPGLGYKWNTLYSGQAAMTPSYGLNYVEPTPIATHVVSADALEALTSYSPCMLALHSMMKQQLQLTSEFIQSQRYMYDAYISSIKADYQYTTLKDTKKYIRKHRKPKMTLEEAHCLVAAETHH